MAVLQTQNRHGLFFNYRTNSKKQRQLYLTQETLGSPTGWTEINLSKELHEPFQLSEHDHCQLAAFQHPQHGTMTIAVILGRQGTTERRFLFKP
jgi:hypothetical protein